MGKQLKKNQPEKNLPEETMRKVWLASLGAFSILQKQAGSVLEGMISEGQSFQRRFPHSELWSGRNPTAALSSRSADANGLNGGRREGRCEGPCRFRRNRPTWGQRRAVGLVPTEGGGGDQLHRSRVGLPDS